MLSGQITALADLPPPRRKKVPQNVVKTEKYPIYYQPITKCGCTFLRHLMFCFDNGAPFRDAEGVLHPAYDGDNSAGEVPPNVIRDTEATFVVIRDPVDRFMSLYFDKFVCADGDKPHREVFRYADDAGSLIYPGTDIETNRSNCHLILDHIASTLDDWPYKKANWHWKPQVVRMRAIRDLRFKTLTLDGLNWQLPLVLDKVVPSLADATKTVKIRNPSPKFLTAEEVLDQPLRDRILRLYPLDTAMYQQVHAYWANHAANPERSAA